MVRNWNKVNMDLPIEPQHSSISAWSSGGKSETFWPMTVVVTIEEMKITTRTRTPIQETISTDSNMPLTSIRSFRKAWKIRSTRRTLTIRSTRAAITALEAPPPSESCCALSSPPLRCSSIWGTARKRTWSQTPKATTKKSKRFQDQSCGSVKKPTYPSATIRNAISVTKMKRKVKLMKTHILSCWPKTSSCQSGLSICTAIIAVLSKIKPAMHSPKLSSFTRSTMSLWALAQQPR
mmetsp:Transcript_21781/g.60871  ORF Transcript_21781/g.60871 Transcript_21781/m.60871 type:complete len:236 (+) Transcript_21781:722-1429(+)